MLNLFGGLMRAAIVEGAKAEWRKVRPSELACMEDQLQQQGTSTAFLAQQEIFPNDGRIAGIRAICAKVAAPPPNPQPPVPATQPVVTTNPQPLSATPTFDCTKARSATGRILCADQAGAKADWDISAAYWAELFSLPEADRDAFKRARDDWLQTLNRTCRLLPDQLGYSPQQRQCVLTAFRTRANAYRSRLPGDDALVESRLSPEEHAEVQGRLIALGHLDASADGEFGPMTREAIKRFQEQSGEPPSEFLTRPQLMRLAQAVSPATPSSVPVSGESIPENIAFKASKLTVVEAQNQCQSNDTEKRLIGCTAIINAKGRRYSVALADAFDGRCRSYDDLAQHQRAVGDCKSAIARNPRHAYAYNNLATALAGLGDTQGAIAAYTKSIEFKSNFIYSYFGRGYAYAGLGDKYSAKKDFEKVLAIDPDNQQAMDAIASLEAPPNVVDNIPHEDTPNTTHEDTQKLKDARIFLDDVQKFIAEQIFAPSSISSIATAAANLQIAVTKFDEGAAIDAEERLNNLLHPIKGFQEFRKSQQDERGRQDAQHLADARNQGTQNVLFIDNYIRRNLLDPKNASLIRLRDQLDAAIKKQQIDDIGKANNALQSFVKDNALSAAYQEFLNAAEAQARQAAAKATAEERARRKTEVEEQARQAVAKAAAEESARQGAEAKAAAEAERQRQEAAAKAAAEAERQRLEREAAAKREADKRARQEAAAKAAAEEQARLLKNDRIFLDDAQAFLKTQTTVDKEKIADIAQAATLLREAIGKFDEAGASQSRTQLHDLLSPIKGFGEFLKDREAERQRVLMRRFGLVEAKAEKGVYFVSEYLREHLGDPKTGTLLTLQGRLEGSLRPNSIDDATIEVVDQANEGLDRFISGNSLSGEYNRIVRAYSTLNGNAAAPPKTIDRLLTEKNKFAVVGPEDDMVLLFNSAPSAPSMAKDIAGKFVFLADGASVCFAQTTPDDDRVWFLERMLRLQGAKDIKRDASECDLSQVLSTNDIVAFQRSELRKQHDDYLIGLLTLLDNDSLREYKIVAEADYESAVTIFKALPLQFASEIEANQRKGFGVLTVADAPLPACLVTSDYVQQLGLGELLARDKELISRRRQFDWKLVNMTVDNAFVALMKEQCGHVVGDADSLRTLMLALRRDRRNYQFAPVWYSIDEVAAAGKEKAKELDKEKREAETQTDTQDAIRRQRDAQKDALIQKLRNENGVRARGLRDRIQEMVKDAADKPLSNSPRRAIETQRAFPSFSAWLNKRFDEQWETTEVCSEEIVDFGSVQWNGRPLDGIVVQTKVTQKNAIQGARKTDCFMFGLVDDVEFSMVRDLFDVECGNSERTIADWKARRQFKSLWNADSSRRTDVQQWQMNGDRSTEVKKSELVPPTQQRVGDVPPANVVNPRSVSRAASTPPVPEAFNLLDLSQQQGNSRPDLAPADDAERQRPEREVALKSESEKRARDEAPTVTPSVEIPPSEEAEVQTPRTNAISWQRALAAHIERFKRYPPEARASGEQGVAKVAFTIDHEGRLVSSRDRAKLRLSAARSGIACDADARSADATAAEAGFRQRIVLRGSGALQPADAGPGTISADRGARQAGAGATRDRRRSCKTTGGRY